MTWNPSQTIETNALAPDPYLAKRFATTVFFVAEGSPPDPVLAQRFESHVCFVVKAIQTAARGMSRTKRIATQTTYRSYKETAL